MAYTLFDITYRVARQLEYLIEGLATGGTATTLVDANSLKLNYSDNWFNGGTVWIIYDAGGAGASPQGKYTRVTDFEKTSGTVTIATVTDAIASGDRYAIATGRYPLDILISKINQALDDLPLKKVDISTITTAAEKTQYNLPADVMDERIAVWIQTNTDDSDAYDWTPWHDWVIQQTSTGSAKLLVMRTQPPQPYLLKIEYDLPHPPLYANTDKLQERLDINRVSMEAAYLCLRWKKSQPGESDPNLDKRIDELATNLERMRSRYPIKKSMRPKLATLGLDERYWVD